MRAVRASAGTSSGSAEAPVLRAPAPPNGAGGQLGGPAPGCPPPPPGGPPGAPRQRLAEHPRIRPAAHRLRDVARGRVVPVGDRVHVPPAGLVEVLPPRLGGIR